jgi:hypothetical protein
VVVAVDELFVGVLSVSLADTVAVLDNVPLVVVCTTMDAVAEVPAASVPKEQTTVVVPLQNPALAEDDWNVTDPGNESEAVTPVAVAGPLLVTDSR